MRIICYISYVKQMYKISLVVVLVAVWIQGFSQSITVSASDNIDYTMYETFRIQKGEFATPKEEREVSDEKLFDIISTAARRELELKGYRYTEDSTARFTVSYVAGAYNVTEGGNLGPLGGVPITNPSMIDQNRYWNEEHRAGLLVLEMTQGKSTTPIWSAEGKVNLTTVEEVERSVDSLVAKMLKKFPSRIKKKKK